MRRRSRETTGETPRSSQKNAPHRLSLWTSEIPVPLCPADPYPDTTWQGVIPPPIAALMQLLDFESHFDNSARPLKNHVCRIQCDPRQAWSSAPRAGRGPHVASHLLPCCTAPLHRFPLFPKKSGKDYSSIGSQ